MIAHYKLSDVNPGVYRPLLGRYFFHKKNSKEVVRIALDGIGTSRDISIEEVSHVFVRPIYKLRKKE